MPPKKNKEPEVSEEELKLKQKEAEEAAAKIVSDCKTILIESADAAVDIGYANYINNQILPFTFSRSFVEIENALLATFVNKDEGERLIKVQETKAEATFSIPVVNLKDIKKNDGSDTTRTESTTMHTSREGGQTSRSTNSTVTQVAEVLIKFEGEWSAEREPTPSTIDFFASNSVTIRKKVKDDGSLSGLGLRGDSRGGGDSASVGGFSVKSKGSRASKATSKSNKTRGSIANKDLQLEEVAEKRPLLVVRPETPPEHNKKSSMAISPEETKRLAIIAEMEKNEKEYNARVAAIAEKERIEEETFKQQVEGLKGKDFTIDRNGKIIPISLIKSDNLPASISLAIEKEVEEPVEENKKKKDNRRGSVVKRKTENKKEINDADFYKQSDTQQPPLLSSIKLVSGVRCKEGEGQREGPVREEDKMHMSRSAFLANTAGQVSIKGQSMEENIYQVKNENKKDAKEEGKEEESFPESFTPRVEVRESRESKHEVMTEKGNYDSNLELIEATDWGSYKGTGVAFSPRAPSPSKANQQSKQETFKTTLKLPRDRPFTSSSANSPKKHLPAPVYPQNIGHGMLLLPSSPPLSPTSSTKSNSNSFLPSISDRGNQSPSGKVNRGGIIILSEKGINIKDKLL